MSNEKVLRPKFGVSPLLQKIMGTLPQVPQPQPPSPQPLSVNIQSKPGGVRFLFSMAVPGLEMSPDDARNMAAGLIAHANLADGLNEDGSPKIITPPGLILPP